MTETNYTADEIIEFLELLMEEYSTEAQQEWEALACYAKDLNYQEAERSYQRYNWASKNGSFVGNILSFLDEDEMGLAYYRDLWENRKKR